MKLFIFDTVKSACYNFFIEFLWEMEEEYAELPDSYVIFICDFDPFGERKYRYTFQMQCKESNQTPLEDGRRIVSKMLSKGLSDEEIMELCDISLEELENLKNHR